MGARQIYLDKINHKRNLTLFKSKTLPQSTIDKDISLLKNDKAAIEQLQAQIDHSKIKAPFGDK